MKKIWLAAFLFIVVVTFSASLTQAAESAVTLQETFEGEYGYNQAGFPLDKIGKASTGAYGKSYEVTNELAYSGEKSMKVMSDTNWWGIFFRANTLVHTAPNGKRYTISFQVAGSPENTKTETLTVKFVYDSVTTTLGTISPKPGEWTEFSAEYAFASNAFENGNQIWEKCEIFIEQAGQGNTYYFDDVLMEEMDPNQVLDIDFEDPTVPGGISSWRADIDLTQNAALGQQALKIVNEANPQLQDSLMSSVTYEIGGGSLLEKKDTTGDVYELSFQYATDHSNLDTVELFFCLSWWNDDSQNPNLLLTQIQAETGTPYTSCTVRFTPDETNWIWSPKLVIGIKAKNAETLYVDEITLKKLVIPDAPKIIQSIPADGGETDAIDAVTITYSNIMDDSALDTDSYQINDGEIKDVTKLEDGSYRVSFQQTLEEQKTYILSIDVTDQYGQRLSTQISFRVLGADRLYHSGIHIYKDYGEDTVRNLSQGVLEEGNLTAVVDDIRNFDSKGFELALICTLYDNGKLEEISMDRLSIPAGEETEETLLAPVSVPGAGDGTKLVKAFLWDFAALEPMTRPMVLTDYKTVVYHVNPDGSGDFLSPKLANEAISDSSAAKRYVIQISPGEYTEVNWTVKPYVTLRGEDRETCVLKGELPDEYGGTAVGRTNIQNYSTINIFDTCTLENLTITAKNLRYPVHNEGNGNNKNATHIVRNCHIEHFGNAGATEYYLNHGGTDKYDVWQWTTAWGYGSASGVLDIFEDSTFRSVDRAWYVHGNASFEEPQVNILTNCHLSAGTKQDITVESLGSGTDDKVILNNCTFDGLYIRAAGSPWLYTAQNTQYADHTDYTITLNNCDPLGYVDTHMGIALAISSDTGGMDSSVSVSGSAADTLFGEAVSKKGGGGFSGYIYGQWDISGYLTGISSNIQVNNTLGRRLGDCSVEPKVLNVTFDGQKEVSVTFNKNYTYMNNGQILNEINAVLSGLGKAYEYQVSQNEYYPEFTDKERYLKNESQTYIKRFAPVCLDGDGIRQMTQEDDASDFLGIALENIIPGTAGRVLTEGYMSADQLGLEQIQEGDSIAVGAGGYVINSGAEAILNCSNDLGWAYFKGNLT